jgi:hypothetical protein
LRARVFRRLSADTYEYAGEIEAVDADDVWRQLEGETLHEGESLAQGDVVYVGDVYHQLDGDGGWAVIPPSTLTQQLYKLAISAESAR